MLLLLAMNPRDLSVALVAILLGLAALLGAASGGKWLAWSNLAARIEQTGGRQLVVVTYMAMGLFLIGVGISLLW